MLLPEDLNNNKDGMLVVTLTYKRSGAVEKDSKAGLNIFLCG
jgi:hypothetical protein